MPACLGGFASCSRWLPILGISGRGYPKASRSRRLKGDRKCTVAKLKDKVALVLRLEILNKFDHVRMVYLLENFDFALKKLSHESLVIRELGLENALNSDYLAGPFVFG